MLGQIVLGGITVLVDLHPLAVQGHMLLSMVLVATAVVLLRRAGEPDDGARAAAVATPSHAASCGRSPPPPASPSSPAPSSPAPDRTPATRTSQRFDVAISYGGRVHGITVMIAIALAVVLARPPPAPPRRPPGPPGAVSSWIFVGLLQAAIGYIQYFNDVPALLVGVHVAGATALWAMTVWLVLATACAVERRRSHRTAVTWTRHGLVPSRST